MDRITEHIQLGGASDTRRLDEVQGVINCTPIKELDYDFPRDLDYVRVPVYDEESIRGRYLDHAMQQMARMIVENKQILIHCIGGKSRSPSILACYLSLSLRITPQEALKFIQSKRYGVEPDQKIWDSVIEYVRTHWSDHPSLPRSERVQVV